MQCEDADADAMVQRGLELATQIQASETKSADGGASKLQQSIGAVMITKDGARVVYTMQLSCTEQNEVFCARDDDDNRLVLFVDYGSEVTLIAESTISKDWEVSQGENINLTGIGGKKKQEGTKASKMVTVPLRLRGAMAATWVTGHVVSDAVLPDGIDILVGKPAIKSMGTKPDSRNMCMEFSEERIPFSCCEKGSIFSSSVYIGVYHASWL